MKNKIVIISLFLLGSFVVQISAQDNAIANALNNNERGLQTKKVLLEKENSFKLWEGWNIGLNYGVTKFKGDITQYDHYPAYQEEGSFFELNTAISISLEKRINLFLLL